MMEMRVHSWTEFDDMLYVRVAFPTKSVHKVFFDYAVHDPFHSVRNSLYAGAGITAVNPIYLDIVETGVTGQPLSWVYLGSAEGMTVLDAEGLVTP